MKKIGLIFNGVWSHYTFATAPKYANSIKLLYVYDLSKELLADLEAIIIPFQSNHIEIAKHKDLLYSFLAQGKKIMVEGDSSANWLDAKWEDRPVNNYWWVDNPNNPPISETNFSHPLYKGLSPRHSCWHTHGAYTSIPTNATVIQRKDDTDIITWETTQYGGHLLVTTLDPIVEHGIQQITHLDNYVDKLIFWLTGENVSGTFQIPAENYGVELPIIL
jgi:hypothetical protein